MLGNSGCSIYGTFYNSSVLVMLVCSVCTRQQNTAEKLVFFFTDTVSELSGQRFIGSSRCSVSSITILHRNQEPLNLIFLSVLFFTKC
jgi:hypothetical protein